MVIYDRSSSPIGVVDDGVKLSDGQILPKYTKGNGTYHLIGRWFPKVVDGISCYVTTASGSEIHAMVRGATSVSVGWVPMVQTDTYFSYSVDGGEYVRQLISNNTIQLADDGEHIIRIIADGIAEDIGKWNGNGYAFSGLTPNAGETIEIIPTWKTVAVFGDSIAEGIRSRGTRGQQFTVSDNSSTGSFTWFTCMYLDAIPYFVGYGASGVIANGSFKKCLIAMDYLADGVADTSESPDLIIIEHGHNDVTTDGADNQSFIDAYTETLDRLRIKYSGVPIVCVIPFTQRGWKAISAIVEDRPDCYLIKTAGWQCDTVDGTHLSIDGAQKAGRLIATQIKTMGLI